VPEDALIETLGRLGSLREAFQVLDFGCKTNQAEGGEIAAGLRLMGLEPPVGSAPARAVVINTCAVTARAVQKARRAARRVRRRDPRALVVVTGCLADLAARRHPAGRLGALEDIADFTVPKTALLSALGAPAARRDAARTRAFVKVQDGCDRRCAYCVVPFARPFPTSKPMEAAVGEITDAVRAGFKEVVLVGTHLGRYGEDLGPGAPRLAGVARAALGAGVERLRLSSLEVGEIDGRLVDLMAREPRIAAHLHVALQSGDDIVLRSMKRPYTAGEFARRLEWVSRGIPDVAFTTDAIVGFPGEDEAAFRRTVDLVRRLRFAKVHVFPFSPRPGTAAVEFPERVRPETIAERKRRLIEVARRTGHDVRRDWIGRRAKVLVEKTWTDGPNEAFAEGLTAQYLRTRARVPAERSARAAGTFLDVTITGAEPDMLCGQCRPSAPADSPPPSYSHEERDHAHHHQHDRAGLGRG
jgi:threonylcarbamoyladenosine tRNA methylthiotransferase MtaB